MKYKFNKEALARFVADKKLKEGYHAGVVVDVVQFNNDNRPDDLTVRIAYKVLEDPDNPASMTGRPFSEFFTLLNDDSPDFAGQMQVNFLHAYFPEEIPGWPIWDKDLKSVVFNGEPIPKSEEINARQKCLLAAGEKAEALWGDGSAPFTELVGSIVFFKIYYKENSDFPSVTKHCAELPEGEELCSPPFEMVGMGEAEAPKKKKKK